MSVGNAIQTDGASAAHLDSLSGEHTAIPTLSVLPVSEPVSGDPVDSLELVKEDRERMRGLRLHEVTTEVLSWAPRIFLLHNLLTKAECDDLIRISRTNLEASSVVDASTGQGVFSSVRTSSGTFLTDDMDPVLKRITDRVSHIVMLPGENQEAMQVLR
jgi:hypothetical protein